MPTPLLEAVGVEGRIGDAFALDVRHFRLDPGERVALVGQSGVGKSTLLHLFAGILAPYRAERLRVRIGDEVVDLEAMWRVGDGDALRRYRRRHVGYVLQSGGLAPFLSVRSNVALATLDSRDGGAEAPLLLQALEIAHLGERKPHRISMGERQRVAIARALVHRPCLVLADEPTASLDPDTAEIVMRLLTAATEQQGAALLMVTHDADLARDHGLRLVRCRRAEAAHRSFVDDREAA